MLPHHRAAAAAATAAAVPKPAAHLANALLDCAKAQGFALMVCERL